MEREDVIERLKQYNKTLSPLCTLLEKRFIEKVEENYFYGFYIPDIVLPDNVDKFLLRQNNFKRLLPEHHEKLCYYLKHIHEWTCNSQLIRMDARSQNFSYYQTKTIRAIGAFYVFYGSHMEMKELVYGSYRQLFSSIDFSPVIAERLLNSDQEVIQYCKDVLTSDNNTAVLTRDVMIAIEQSYNSELQDLLTQLFLAARLQEGLRQSIIETVDENNVDYFLKIIDVIAENDLLRYSSVQRGVLTWIGIGYDIVKGKEIYYIFEHIQSFFHNVQKRQDALSSQNPLDVYLALYCQGVFNVDKAISIAISLLDSSKPHIVASCLIYLKLTNSPYLHLLLPHLKKFNDNEWIKALFISECCRYDFKKVHLKSQEIDIIFDELENFVKSMKTQQNYSSKGFEWFSLTLYKSIICHCLSEIIEQHPSSNKVDRFLPYVHHLYQKKLNTFMEKSFPLATIEAKKAFMLKEIISNNDDLGDWIEKEYKKIKLTPLDIQNLEIRLKTKKSKARVRIINVLAGLDEKQVKESYQRLINSKTNSIQESALELQQKVPQYFQGAIKEKVKIYSREEGFGLYQPKTLYNLAYHSKLKTIKKGLFVKKEQIDFSTLFPWNKMQVLDYLRIWNQRITEHQDDEYDNGYTYRQLKERYFYPLNYKERSLRALPLSHLWKDYFAQDHLNKDIIFELRLLLEGIDFQNILKIDTPLFVLYKKDIQDLQYYNHICKILSYYFYEFEDQYDFSDKVAMLLEIICQYCKYYQYQRILYNNEKEITSLSHLFPFLMNQLHLEKGSDEHFCEYFPFMQLCYEYFNLKCKDETTLKMTIPPMILARAVMLKLLPKEALYEGILDTHNFLQRKYYSYGGREHQLLEAYRDAYFEGAGIVKKPHFNLEDYHHPTYQYDIKVFAYLRKELDFMTHHFMTMEKVRLNEQTAVTPYVKCLYVINGVQYLIEALHVLEHESLKRQHYGDDRNAVFTDIIRRCYPLDSDDPQTLHQEHFMEERLVEVAMIAPQWIEFINQVLKWDGFKEACYYFIAHMKQYDYTQKKAQIAHYTQIDPEDLNDGAFDMEWCKNVYQLLGEKRFQMLYKASQFLCDNSFHTRARKYADACLMKTDLESLYKQVKEKRNKDALNAYCIYPLKDEKDLLTRYLTVQQFLKESKQFGSQRQASEKRACEIAMINLAKNSRYQTVTRLSWMMETEMFKQYEHFLRPQQLEDIQLWIEIDEQGRNDIKVLKNNRKQKSIPAKFKKNELVLEMKNIHKKWNEQYRRSRNMLQQAMEERTEFTFHEVQTIMKNPIVAPMLSKLVLISHNDCGFYDQNQLQGINQRYEFHDHIRIAHPYDLYRKNCWHEFQEYIFNNKIIQPFKQVFRELYLKLDDEMDQSSSKRYTGYQIQPKKAAATLKSRGWNVSYENGLEKIIYHDNLIVNLSAQADWFSPSDIEAPSIDYVQFYTKKEYQPALIKNIDSIVFSEIMRDVDLAVSTAFVGGVDPVTSFSTMELRKTIVAYTCQLMKLDNVTVQDHFVHIQGVLNNYSIHLGSGMIHQDGGTAIWLVTVWSGKRGKVYLPFLDEDPKTAEIISKVVLLAEDQKIKDPAILKQITTKVNKKGFSNIG